MCLILNNFHPMGVACKKVGKKEPAIKWELCARGITYVILNKKIFFCAKITLRYGVIISWIFTLWVHLETPWKGVQVIGGWGEQIINFVCWRIFSWERDWCFLKKGSKWGERKLWLVPKRLCFIWPNTHYTRSCFSSSGKMCFNLPKKK